MENIYMNRELSWLKFNERVLEEAENKSVPLCERMTFVSIYQSNLDEFFRVRVGSLQDQMLINTKIRDNKTNMTSEEQIKAILKEVKRLNKRKDAAYEDLMELELDDSICTVMDYFEIFLKRMIMCRRAAERLKCKFKLVANGSKLC